MKVLKHGLIYQPKKDDSIDLKLDKFLNTLTPKPPIQFVREHTGVYQFGTKRVFIKIEQNDTILVRVGGGYMKLPAFIDHYTNIELEKLGRKTSLPGLLNINHINES